MANPEHLEILQLGVEAWNEWRAENTGITPDLSGTDLSRRGMSGINLSKSNLSETYLRYSTLNAANLSGANLHFSDLLRCQLRGATLSYTNLSGAKLWHTDMHEADVAHSELTQANLDSAVLENTRFKECVMIRATFRDAVFANTDFSNSWLGATMLINNDLRNIVGLNTVQHAGPSEISLSTLNLSHGIIPEVFLRGCGVSDAFITYMRSLTMQPIQFYSCFISYSSKDQEFAERLHADLQAKGVRVWFAPHDLPIGARIRPAIDESIRLHDKLLLVLSETSVSSQWVEQEVETALRKERRGGGEVLFPVRLDDTVFEIGEGWPALVKDTRYVGDFTRWKEHDSYRKAFDRLLRDLKAEA